MLRAVAHLVAELLRAIAARLDPPAPPVRTAGHGSTFYVNVEANGMADPELLVSQLAAKLRAQGAQTNG